MKTSPKHPLSSTPLFTPPPPWVKICCIACLEEAQLAIGAGASAQGLVSAMPSGPGVIEEARSVADLVGALLLDSGNRKLSVKEPGGTGVRTDGVLDYSKPRLFMSAVGRIKAI